MVSVIHDPAGTQALHDGAAQAVHDLHDVEAEIFGRFKTLNVVFETQTCEILFRPRLSRFLSDRRALTRRRKLLKRVFRFCGSRLLSRIHVQNLPDIPKRFQCGTFVSGGTLPNGVWQENRRFWLRSPILPRKNVRGRRLRHSFTSEMQKGGSQFQRFIRAVETLTGGNQLTCPASPIDMIREKI